MKEITVQELKAKIDNNQEFQLIDVREEHEVEICDINGLNIPMGNVIDRIEDIKKDIPVIVHCRSGARSGAITQMLEKNYAYNNVYNLKGGILAWIGEIDPSLTSY
jgi:sulfur-carrier protein adenylyltransferase/sulfurtransferase